MNPVFSEFNREGFVGVARADFLSKLPVGRLSGLHNEVEGARDRALALGRHQVVVIDFEYEGTMRPVAVKYFGKQSAWKDRYDRKHGSKAARSFKAAGFLGKNKISTPPALAYFERWDKGRTFNGPWPVKLNKVLDCLGKEIELIEIKDQPVYLINSN